MNPYETSSYKRNRELNIDLDFDINLHNDSRENHWSAVHQMEQHNTPRHEEDLHWLSRQNDIWLEKTNDKDLIICNIIEKLSHIERSVDESIWDYYARVETEMM